MKNVCTTDRIEKVTRMVLPFFLLGAAFRAHYIRNITLDSQAITFFVVFLETRKNPINLHWLEIKKGNSEELICLPHFPLALLLDNTGPHKVRFPDSTGDIWQDYFPHLWQLNFLSNRIFNGWHFLQCIIKGKNRNTIYALVLSNKINSLQNMLGCNIFAYSCQS